MGNSLILKEGKAFNLGDGKFSGFPKFEMMASLGKLKRSGKFGTTRRMKSQNRKWRQTGVFYLLFHYLFIS